MLRITLLGPQRLRPTLVTEVERAGLSGSIAVVTAGWQERECEVDELGRHLGRRVVNLELHARAEDVFEKDAELFTAYRARQERLRSLQQVYRLRLDHAMAPARELLQREGDTELLDPEREHAIAAIRALDRHHLERLRAVVAEFQEEWQPWERDRVAYHRRKIRKRLRDCDAFAVAGGHVAVLLNRLRLFGLADLLEDQDVFAWAAGAMVLGTQVVLFHDSPPQGQGNAEVLEAGLELYSGILPLPDARHRLRLHDRARVSLLARRFAGYRCMAMDEGACLRFDEGVWEAVRARHLRPNGSVRELAA